MKRHTLIPIAGLTGIGIITTGSCLLVILNNAGEVKDGVIWLACAGLAAIVGAWFCANES